MAEAAADGQEGRARAGRQEPQRRLRRRRLRHRRRHGPDRGLPALRARSARPVPGWSSRTSIHDRFVDELVARAEQIRLGGPFDADAETGTLISAAHRDKIEAYVAAGARRGRGAALRRQAPGRPGPGRRLLLPADDPRRLRPEHVACVHDESFGPVLTVETFTDEDDAVRIANDTVYGLAGAVWTQDAGKAQRVAERLRHGTVWINDYHPYLPQAEWGGFKQSGIGRELGPTGLAEYRETKHIWQNIDPAPQHWFGGLSRRAGGERMTSRPAPGRRRSGRRPRPRSDGSDRPRGRAHPSTTSGRSSAPTPRASPARDAELPRAEELKAQDRLHRGRARRVASTSRPARCSSSWACPAPASPRWCAA